MEALDEMIGVCVSMRDIDNDATQLEGFVEFDGLLTGPDKMIKACFEINCHIAAEYKQTFTGH